MPPTGRSLSLRPTFAKRLACLRVHEHTINQLSFPPASSNALHHFQYSASITNLTDQRAHVYPAEVSIDLVDSKIVFLLVSNIRIPAFPQTVGNFHSIYFLFCNVVKIKSNKTNIFRVFNMYPVLN